MTEKTTTPKNKWLLLIWAILATCQFSNLSAKNIFNLNWKKSGNGFQNTLKVTEFETGFSVATIQLPNSYKYSSDLYHIDGSNFAVIYYRSKKNQAHLTIIDTHKLEIINQLNIDPLNFAFDEINRTNHWFLSFNQELTEFLIFVGKGKKQKLLAIDLSSGQVVKEYNLGRGATKILRSYDRRFLWAEKINLRNKPIRLFDTASHTELQSIAVDSRQLQTQSIGDLLFIQHKVKLNKNSTTNTHQVIILKMTENKVIHKFNSSYPTSVLNTESEQGIFLLGRSFGKTKNFMLHQIDLNDEVKDKSPQKLDFKPLWAQLKITDESIHLFATGDHHVLKLDMNDGNKFKVVSIPDKSDNAIINRDGNLLYYTQASGSKVGLVDFNKGQFINAERTGRSEVKFGQFVGTFLSAALTSPSGVSIYPTNGLQLSKNFLMLSNNQKWLFALNAKTDDVTIFKADDISDKKVIATGKRTFQMIQSTTSDDLPVALLSNEMISYISSDSGELLGQISYDAIKELRGAHLVVETDGRLKTISLFYPEL